MQIRTELTASKNLQAADDKTKGQRETDITDIERH